MSIQAQRLGLLPRLLWWLCSVPIFIKILGIGFIVAAVFGSITLFTTTGVMSQSLYHLLQERAVSSGSLLALSLEGSISPEDLPRIQARLLNAKDSIPGAQYIIVRDKAGQIIAHTFKSEVPPDLKQWPVQAIIQHPETLELSSRESAIVEARCPILKGSAGVLQLGVSDREFNGEVNVLAQSLLLALAASIALGTALGLLLTYLLAHPIHSLVQTAGELARGDFNARAEIYSADEIGRLAATFNQMATSLVAYRRIVEEKERARLALLDRVIQAQEEERKSISRELHDQVGQSLAALMLTVQSDRLSATVKNDAVHQISSLSTEIHRLAWGMRPSTLDDYGLELALSSYLDSISKPAALKVDFEYNCPAELGRPPSRVEVTLYRIAQEAITNVIRHARATRASVIVLRQRGNITLLVEDDGQGFVVEDVQSPRLGLMGMRERVALLGGECIVESRPGKGTTIRVNIPQIAESDAGVSGEEACRFAS